MNLPSRKQIETWLGAEWTLCFTDWAALENDRLPASYDTIVNGVRGIRYFLRHTSGKRVIVRVPSEGADWESWFGWIRLGYHVAPVRASFSDYRLYHAHVTVLPAESEAGTSAKELPLTCGEEPVELGTLQSDDLFEFTSAYHLHRPGTHTVHSVAGDEVRYRVADGTIRFAPNSTRVRRVAPPPTAEPSMPPCAEPAVIPGCDSCGVPASKYTELLELKQGVNVCKDCTASKARRDHAPQRPDPKPGPVPHVWEGPIVQPGWEWP